MLRYSRVNLVAFFSSSDISSLEYSLSESLEKIPLLIYFLEWQCIYILLKKLSDNNFHLL